MLYHLGLHLLHVGIKIRVVCRNFYITFGILVVFKEQAIVMLSLWEAKVSRQIGHFSIGLVINEERRFVIAIYDHFMVYLVESHIGHFVCFVCPQFHNSLHGFISWS